MANLVRVRTVWTGTPLVGPTVSTFYFDEIHVGFVADLHTFWAAVGNRFPPGITWTTDNVGDLIDVATGELSGTWTDGVPSIISSSGAGSFAQGVGARATWLTSGIRNGRRVKGSTFLVPLTTACYQSDGTIDGAVLGSLSTAAGALVTNSTGEMRIYSRPTDTEPGQDNVVVGGVCPDKVSWLRSRRT